MALVKSSLIRFTKELTFKLQVKLPVKAIHPVFFANNVVNYCQKVIQLKSNIILAFVDRSMFVSSFFLIKQHSNDGSATVFTKFDPLRFFLFLKLKTDIERIMTTSRVGLSFYQKYLGNWKKRCQKYIISKRDYFEVSQLILMNKFLFF